MVRRNKFGEEYRQKVFENLEESWGSNPAFKTH